MHTVYLVRKEQRGKEKVKGQWCHSITLQQHPASVMWLCEPWGASHSGCLGWCQQSEPGAQLRGSAQVTSLGDKSEALGWHRMPDWPVTLGGRDPCLGHAQPHDPLTSWWECDSHVQRKQQRHLQTAAPPFAQWTYRLIRSDGLNDVFDTKMGFNLTPYFLFLFSYSLSLLTKSIFFKHFFTIKRSAGQFALHCLKCSYAQRFHFHCVLWGD